MKTPRHVYRAHELSSAVEKLFVTGITRGAFAGFETLHEYFSIKRGVTTYIFGSPFSGKSEFWFEILLNLSELYGWRHAIFSPETGKASEIIAELISKRARAPFYKTNGDQMSEKDYHTAVAFIHEYFYIIDPGDEGMTLETFYKTVDEIEKADGVTIDSTLVDPYNELENDISTEGGRQDLFIEKQLGIVRRNAQAKNRHNVLITHCRDQQSVKKTVDGREIWYYPPATAREIAGGQAWFRKAMNLINVWRPPVGWKENEWDTPAEENEAHIIIQKFKPKGTGKRGVVKLYFDTQRNRYYEKTDTGSRKFSGAQSNHTARTNQLAGFDF